MMKCSEMVRRTFGIGSLFTLLVAAGCGSEAGPNYKGTSLMSLSGSVRIENPDAPADLVPALAFQTPSGLVIQDVDVVGKFPAKFTLNVFEPPPSSALVDIDDVGRIGLAFVTAVPPDHPDVIAVGSGSTVGTSGCGFDDTAPFTEQFETCTADRSSCYTEISNCTCPDGTCTLVETRGDPGLKNPWTKFGGVSENVALFYLTDEALGRLNMRGSTRVISGGQGLRKGYNVFNVRLATAEEQKASMDCEARHTAQAFATYNAHHGTSYTGDSVLPPGEIDSILMEVSKISDDLEKQEYCGSERVFELIDTSSQSIEVQLGTNVRPLADH